MNNKVSTINYLDRIEELPEEIQDFLFAPETIDTIRNIAAEFDLDLETKVPVISDIVADIAFGVIPLKNLSLEFRQKLNLDESGVKRMTDEINQRLFSRIRSSLEGMQTKYAISIPTPPPPPPAPPPKATEYQSPPLAKEQPLISVPKPETFEVRKPEAPPPPRVTISPVPPPPPPKPSSIEIRPAGPPKEAGELPVQPIRYAQTKKIEEVPKVIRPIPPSKEIIDLSTFQTVRVNPPASLTEKKEGLGPKVSGNTLNLK